MCRARLKIPRKKIPTQLFRPWCFLTMKISFIKMIPSGSHLLLPAVARIAYHVMLFHTHARTHVCILDIFRQILFEILAKKLQSFNS